RDLRDRVCQRLPNSGIDIDMLQVKFYNSRYWILILQLVLGMSRLQVYSPMRKCFIAGVPLQAWQGRG
ncbi:MAG: hypothetical protein AAF974_13450, partial [Cyanobacteria bacterium P01_E01_bin.34]